MATGELDELLTRHQAFWSGEAKTALKQLTPHVPLKGGGETGSRYQTKTVPLAGGQYAAEGQFITPELIDPGAFYPQGSGPDSALAGDFIAGTAPPHLCWTEAIVGCPVRVVTGGPWAEPFFGDWAGLGSLKPVEAWLSKLDEFVDFLAARAAGRYPVFQPLFRGPIDMMTFALGHDRVFLELMDSPDRTSEFLEACTDIFIETARRRLEHTPPFEGGYASSYGIWAPGRVLRTQVDNATLLSPSLYRKQVLPHDRRIIETVDYPLIHLHSGCLHIVDDLLELEALKAIQVSLDYPGGPLASDVMPILQRILQKKSLIVTGPVTGAELLELEALSPQGRLCMRLNLLQEGAAAA